MPVGISRQAATAMATPTGPFTKNTSRQPSPPRSSVTSQPPSTNPSPPPSPSAIPNTPNALDRAASGNSVWIVASTCGDISAAVAPCTRRAATSSPAECAQPHHSDAAVKPSRPSRNIRLRPWISPSRPPVITRLA